jgi:glyoxylase-like metal-dependent hydrolase (beta-lactamase superfamily II)
MPQELILKSAEVGPWPMNTYALICPETRQSVLFDPGADPDTLEGMLEGSTPIAILITHTHFDHVAELDEMRGRLNVPVMAHPGPHAQNITLDTDRELNTGDTVQVGNHTLHVYHAPGHIPDQICFVIENDNGIIVGDTIFEGGPGRTWTPKDFKTTLETLREVVLPWPDDSVCYPGHGPYFRLGDKRAAIEAFVNKDHGNFHGDATWEM